MRSFVLRVRTTVFFFVLAFTAFSSHAQEPGKIEIGAGVGPLFFLGDLGGNMGKGTTLIKDINFPVTNISKNIYLNVHPTEWMAFRLAFSTGMLEGADSLINDKGGAESYRKVRNLHFRSRMTELYAAAEIYPTVFFEQYDGLAGKLRPYGLIGIGVFKFNPQALYYAPNGTSRWVDLAPLKTEGQGMSEYPNRKDYKLTQLEIPMGFGAKYYLNDNMYLGLEILHRKTFTDYVDDVSTSYIDADLFDKYHTPQNAVVAKQVYYRGFSTVSRPDNGEQRGQQKNNDSFFSSILRFGFRFNNGPNAAMNMMRCPKF